MFSGSLVYRNKINDVNELRPRSKSFVTPKINNHNAEQLNDISFITSNLYFESDYKEWQGIATLCQLSTDPYTQTPCSKVDLMGDLHSFAHIFETPQLSNKPTHEIFQPKLDAISTPFNLLKSFKFPEKNLFK